MLYIDASRYNNTTRKTGVENYSFFLINELTKQNPDQITLISPRKVDLKVAQKVIPMKRLWTQLRLSWEIFRNRKIDNLFIPSHVMPMIHPRRTIITIHDVAFRRFPDSYSKKSYKYLDWSAKFAVKNAKRILVPSQATKNDLVKFYDCPEEKISVVPLGIEPPTSKPTSKDMKEVLEKYNLQKHNYFLFIGRIETKKNVHTLLKAFDQLSKEHPKLKLVLAGKTGVGGNDMLIKINNRNVVVTGYIEEKEKQVLLDNCLAFTFPSLYEGFGLPLLEAMQANVPIIASKIPSSLEILKARPDQRGGENALFFKPQDVNALVKHMKAVAEKPELREELTKNHSKTLKQYSWKRCAERTLEILKLVKS